MTALDTAAGGQAGERPPQPNPAIRSAVATASVVTSDLAGHEMVGRGADAGR